ncbi:unnamed protein product [Cyprideis torosa]|uniref:Uncharacterized protein n=1 Tax=Cyprideis torosa TaxID=163714 RepID=A0A7R8WHP8_9CRUS|nr:unnamed protein product [Cyprideis torosa]CAG0899741.1 unnamed protein product [Cyprideis torosa]
MRQGNKTRLVASFYASQTSVIKAHAKPNIDHATPRERPGMGEPESSLRWWFCRLRNGQPMSMSGTREILPPPPPTPPPPVRGPGVPPPPPPPVSPASDKLPVLAANEVDYSGPGWIQAADGLYYTMSFHEGAAPLDSHETNCQSLGGTMALPTVEALNSLVGMFAANIFCGTGIKDFWVNGRQVNYTSATECTWQWINGNVDPVITTLNTDPSNICKTSASPYGLKLRLYNSACYNHAISIAENCLCEGDGPDGHTYRATPAQYTQDECIIECSNLLVNGKLAEINDLAELEFLSGYGHRADSSCDKYFTGYISIGNGSWTTFADSTTIVSSSHWTTGGLDITKPYVIWIETTG